MTESRSTATVTDHTAWARRLKTPLRRFLATQTGSAAVLLGATIVALAWVNVSPSSYETVWHTPLSIRLGGAGLSLDLHDWVNSGLMTFFFFVVGLEARREFDLGELRERSRLAMPVLAGLGGMIVPIAIYLAFNAGLPSAHGWGTAMSTDTAFALGLLALVGRQAPDRMRTFLLTFAVVDDLAGIVVIAIFYSHHISLPAAAGRAGRLRGGARRPGGRGPAGRRVPRRWGWWRGRRSSALRRRSGGGRPGDGPVRRRRPGRAQRPGTRHGKVPALPRAADARAGPGGQHHPVRRRSRPTSGCRRPSTRGRATSSCRCSRWPTRASRSAARSWPGRSPRRSPSASWPGTCSASRSGITGTSFLVDQLSQGRLGRRRLGRRSSRQAPSPGIGFTVSLLIASLAFTGPELAEAKVGVLAAALCASILTSVVFRVTALLPSGSGSARCSAPQR